MSPPFWAMHVKEDLLEVVLCVHTLHCVLVTNPVPAHVDIGAGGHAQDSRVQEALQHEVASNLVLLLPCSGCLPLVCSGCHEVLYYGTWLQFVEAIPPPRWPMDEMAQLVPSMSRCGMFVRE